MLDGVLFLIVMTAALSLAALARRRDVQPSLIIVTLAGAASFVPWIPRFELDPDTILGLVLPPLLFAATRGFAVTHFLRNLRPIAGLGIGLVVVTGVVSGFAASWVVPGLSLSAAMVLGAVVSPPDTVTIVTHGRRLGMSQRVVAILTGECLVNDAAALTMFAVTVATVTGTDTFIDGPVLLYLYDTAVGVAIGILLGVVTNAIRRRLGDASLATAIGLILPFSAYLVAEHLHASGVLAVVAAGFSMSLGSTRLDYETRLREDHTWFTIDSLLETFVFAYMGMQVSAVVREVRASGYDETAVLVAGVVLLVVVIAIRPAAVFMLFGQHRLARRLRGRVSARSNRKPRGRRRVPVPLTVKDNIVVSWTGMRGIVTLAAAGGIPLTTVSGAPFEGRPVIQAIAFIVAIGTLLIQGSSLPWLIRTLDIDDSVERHRESEALVAADGVAQEAARTVLTRRAVQAAESGDGDSALVRLVEAYLDRDAADTRTLDADDRRITRQLIALWHEVADAQREALLQQWRTGEIEEAAMRTTMNRIDLRQASIEAAEPH